MLFLKFTIIYHQEFYEKNHLFSILYQEREKIIRNNQCLKTLLFYFPFFQLLKFENKKLFTMEMTFI